MSKTCVHLRYEFGRLGLLEREDRQGVPLWARVVPVRRVQERRATTRECGREQQLGSNSFAERFFGWTLESRRRAEEGWLSWEWREVVRGECVCEFVQCVQDVLCASCEGATTDLMRDEL